MEHPLVVFEQYSELLDEQFDDGLVIEYENFDKPTFKIIYDPTVDVEELKAAIPEKWRQLEKNGSVRIIIKKYTKKPGQFEVLLKKYSIF